MVAKLEEYWKSLDKQNGPRTFIHGALGMSLD